MNTCGKIFVQFYRIVYHTYKMAADEITRRQFFSLFFTRMAKVYLF